MKNEINHNNNVKVENKNNPKSVESNELIASANKKKYNPLIEVLKTSNFGLFKRKLAILISGTHEKSLKLWMLETIIAYADNTAIMNRLINEINLPWSKIHGKYLCRSLLSDGLIHIDIFAVNHLVFPELYLSGLIKKSISFAPLLIKKEIKDSEWNKKLSTRLEFSRSFYDFRLIYRKLDEIKDRFGDEVIYQVLISSLRQKIKEGIEKSDNIQDIRMIFFIFPNLRDCRIADDDPFINFMLENVELLDTKVNPFKMYQTICRLLPRPMPEDNLNYILKNLRDKDKYYFGLYYPEWNIENIKKIKKSGFNSKSILLGISKNLFIINNKVRFIAKNLYESYKSEDAKHEKLTEQKHDLSLMVIPSFKPTSSEKDNDRLKIYTQMSDKEIPLVACPDPEEVFSKLTAIFPWAERANEIISRQVSLNRIGRGYVYINPILLLGRTGVGKTYYSQVLSEILGIPRAYYGAAGTSDSKLLKGSARGWAESRPSLAIDIICQKNIANPMILIDEIDKSSSSTTNGREEDYLHHVLDPDSARCVIDECLMVPCDLSAITWILTANHKDHLSGSLLNRLTVIEIPAPQKAHYETIVRNTLLKTMENYAIHENQLPDIPDWLWDTFIQSAHSPRTLKKMIETWIGEVGRKVTMQ